ncbi:MAG: beta strand repeat-containing protein, partial [Dehalococcoidia bacterium]
MPRMRRLALALSLAGVGAGLIVVAVSLGWGGSVAAQPRGQFRAFLPGLAADSARGAPFTPVATTTSQAVLVTPTPPIIVISPGFVAPAATSTATPTPQPVTLVTPTPTSTATATPTPVPVPGNTPPSFVKGADVTVLEDAGPQTVNGWATAISSGTPPEAAQPVQFIVTGNTNAALFAAGPAVSPTGTLTFTPAANANGTATVTVVLRDNGGTSGGGNDTSPAQSFVINVTAVNDAPSFTAGPNQSVDQDSGAHAVNPWATTVSAGAANEGAQTLTFAVTSNSTPGLFSAGPAISPSGALTYTPAAGQTGTATISVTLSDNGGTANGGVDTSAAQSFTITVLVVNTPPTAVDDPATVLEDAGATAIPVLANDTDPDGGPMLVQSVTQPANGAVAITGGGTGLTYAPALNYCNTPPGTTLDTFTYTLNGGSTATVSMTVTCVNDAPSFTAVNPPTVVEDAGAQSIASWITGFSPGPANESTQTALAYPVSNVSNPALFSAGPAVAADGTLTYTPAANASGSSTFQVRVQDSGGTADGGVDLSPLQTFTVTVTGLAPDLALTKSDGAVTVAPGGTVTYALGYSNGGTAAAAGVVITETVPAGSSFNAGASTAGWACVPNANAGSSCTFAVGAVAIGGSGSVNFAVNVTGAVAQLSNTAAIADDGADGADLDPANNSATDTTPVVLPSADLSITKTNGVATLAPGAQTTYTITVVNSGPNGVSGVSVADTFPAALTGVTWTCVGAGGGTCTAAGTGSIADSVNLPNGASVTYTATGTVSAGATGTLANTATVSYPADPAPGNNSATDTDSLGAQADLAITKTDGVTTVAVGGTTTYTIVASNAGPSNVTAATVADTFPAAISGATWTCVGAGGGTCTGAGSGNLSDTVNLPSGGSVTYTVVATISGAASPGTLVNTATVSSAATDPAPANNSATDTDTLVVVNNAPSFTSGG